jgi:FHS family L-fucose permease-like MFS transporter
VVLGTHAAYFISHFFYSTIFALGLVNPDDETKTGSSLLVMAIVGGAVFPFSKGRAIGLNNDNIQIVYAVPLSCFLIIIYFG